MSFVIVETPRPGICQITLNRPERMNAMAFDVMVPFKEALEKVGYDNDIRAVIVTGVDAGSLHSHMNHEGHAQLFVRMTTKNFEEAIVARKEGRKPEYKD